MTTLEALSGGRFLSHSLAAPSLCLCIQNGVRVGGQYNLCSKCVSNSRVEPSALSFVFAGCRLLGCDTRFTCCLHVFTWCWLEASAGSD
jgi:hypothetical protein